MSQDVLLSAYSLGFDCFNYLNRYGGLIWKANRFEKNTLLASILEITNIQQSFQIQLV